MVDPEIVDLYWQRSDMAIPETARKYGRYCHSIAYNICFSREDAEECVNDTYFKAWRMMPDKRPSVLSVFLGRITRNLALDRCRANNSKKRGRAETVLALHELEDCIPDSMNVEQSYEEKELKAAIGTFVAGLPEPDRNIFVARYWFLASMAEISRRTGCGEGRLRTRLYRLRRGLREYLQREGLL